MFKWTQDRNGVVGGVSVVSHNQSGGITAHTVNLAPQPRQMNDQVGAEILRNIDKAAKVTVITVMGDSEAHSFAIQVLNWLKTKGYTDVHGVDQAVFSGLVTGQNLEIINEREFRLVIGSRP